MKAVIIILASATLFTGCVTHIPVGHHHGHSVIVKKKHGHHRHHHRGHRKHIRIIR
ncbi:hypothetical protein [Pseudobacteriovorax antillogorgiicola]|uniref:Lipoprotein n=1 Tax=Pseudobacteriovorax antillogorgiicola TaxID=1513793 RepID=A0A1Y6C5X1_9BACT|nr:hypothetical protein [Pseudobacteriovorax antillogorgiicola]TCS49375.1 hypothetical protein EDD56_11555 [Pseudobacteriovorax antillogorgiicola]SMF47381.1 hypothetical protein SAMN06296036_114129 [Pseudobacteriovorax antillogorgiicola]